MYRTSGLLCPSCPTSSPLREFQHRLVCDECAGMLIAVDDFVDSLREIDGSTDELTFSNEAPTAKACPRCARELSSCVLRFGKLKLVGSFSRCERDGIWFPRDAMTAVFARVSRRSSGMGGGGPISPSSSGTLSYGNVAGGGMSGAMSSIANAFGRGAAASAGLRVGNWSSHRPRVHTLYVSAHKDRRLGCPSCKETALSYAGDRWPCHTCAGAFVENAALAAMVEELSAAPWEVPVGAGALGERACPVCTRPMMVEVLEAVTIDRCGDHGVWFDEHELQDALHHVIDPSFGGDAPTGIGGWVKRLFWRHGTTE
ncbi:MAG: zf-TFIIB domain-containing protein [Proteobacteria bacterium]|nr:zf-TFIIB domain-containing protein [Pseudomonadota bacterium]